MIQNYFDNVKRILWSLILNARVLEGGDKSIYLFSILKIIGSLTKRVMRTGKKSASGCSSKKVRTLSKRYRQFTISSFSQALAREKNLTDFVLWRQILHLISFSSYKILE